MTQLEQIQQAVAEAWGVRLPIVEIEGQDCLLMAYRSAKDGARLSLGVRASQDGALLSEHELGRHARAIGRTLAYSLATTGDTAEAVECDEGPAAGALEALTAEIERCVESFRAMEEDDRRAAQFLGAHPTQL